MKLPACDPDYGGRHRWKGSRGLDLLELELPGHPGVLVLSVACSFCGVVRLSRYLGAHRDGAVLGYRDPVSSSGATS